MQENIYKLNGVEYSFVVMPPSTGVPLSTRLAKIIAGGGSDLDVAELMDGKKDNKIGETSTIVKFLSSMLVLLGNNEPLEIWQECQPFIFVKGKDDTKPHPCNLDADFIGKTFDFYKVLASFLRYTFSDFFIEIAKILGLKIAG